ncbi:MAG TPA: serine protease [Terriglobales bacterium]|nr:serine protease [Terriglobales bacterium]
MRDRFAVLAGRIRRTNLWRTACVFLFVALVVSLHSSAPSAAPPELAGLVARLSAEVEALKQESSMPGEILNRHRDSICYIYGEYSFGPTQGPARKQHQNTRFSGTGFVVAPGLVATNRHVVEPWYDDAEAGESMRAGAQPRLEKVLAFFPGHGDGVELSRITVARDTDVAVAHFDAQRLGSDLRPLPLAEHPGSPGDPVVVVGYPMGLTAMVAKSPRPVYQRLAYRRADISVARELAALSLIRPSATHGHLGDLVGDKLIYDAATAHGGSGGPVFNYQGLVIGVNTAYLDGFSGSTLGISVRALRPVIEKALSQH